MGEAQPDISQVVAAMPHSDLLAYRDYLDERIRGDKATLEDFGRLSHVLQEISRRETAAEAIRCI